MEYELTHVKGLIKAVQDMLRFAMSTTRSPHPQVVSPGPSEEDKRELAKFLACADPGRKKSLRSLEIPLENLLSGIIFLSGGRDYVGRPIISLTQPEQNGVEDLMELTDQELLDMFAYFTSVPSEEARSSGFSVVIDGDVIHDFLMRPMIKALATIQLEDRAPFRKVYYVSSSRDLNQVDWNAEFNGHSINLPFHQVPTYKALHEFISKDQLTSEFDGTLSYSHQDWVKFRMQVEPFLCDCISVSKRLARAIEPFTEDSVPHTIEEAKESIKKNRLVRRKTLEALHIDELATEGSRINEHMKATKKLSDNPEFSNTLNTITKLMEQIDTVKGRLETLWGTRQEKLETNLKQQVFEKNAEQIIEWYEEYAEEFFQTHTELGESLEIALALEQEVKQFEDSTKQILQRTGKLFESGSNLESHPHANQEAVTQLMGKVKHLMGDFDRRLSFRKKKLNDSVRLHQLTEAALDWCIESAGVLSEHDLLTVDPRNMDVERVKKDFDQFLQNYPAPTDEELHQLQELTEAMGNTWIKGNAEFAYNRVMEVSAKFQHYSKLLDSIMEEKRRQSQEAKLLQTDSATTSGERDRMLLDAKAIPHSISDVCLRSTHQQDFERKQSLLYDDTGVDHALLLLDGATKSVDKLTSPTSVDSEEGDLDLVDFLESLNGEVRSSGSPLPHHISKRDISLPTKTAGPLFTSQADILGLDDEEIEEVGERSDSVPPEEETLRPASVQEQMRARVLSAPCPDSDMELAAQTKHAKHRRKLMEELIETEESYIRALQWVVDKYMPAMDDIEDVPRNLFGKKNYVFSTLPQLLQFNRLVILPQLQSCRKCPIKLGSLFLTFEEDLLNYSMYFKNMPHQTRLMNEGGIDFFASVSQRVGDSFPLQSYLIKPFQRMAKYKLFLEDMIKHSVKSDLKGKLKEYYDHLKEAQKMADFILRHGNDLLAVECLRGYDGIKEQGKILRQGDLTVVELSKHRRRVFLFEDAIILSKKRKPKHQHHDIPGSEYFDFKAVYKTNEFSLRENIDGHPTRFELRRKKEVLVFQADTVDDKNIWVQDIWDLFFSHMLALKDQNLEVYGSRPLTSLAAVGPNRSATIGRSFGHNVRRAMSIRHSGGMRVRSRSRPGSAVSSVSVTSSSSSTRASGGAPEELAANLQPGGGNSTRALSPSTQNRHSGTFVDLRSKSPSRLSATSLDIEESESKRSSIVSTSSASTIVSLNLPPQSPIPMPSHSPGPIPHIPHISSPAPPETVSKLISAVHRAGEGGSPSNGASSGDDVSSNSELTGNEDNGDVGENITVFESPL